MVTQIGKVLNKHSDNPVDLSYLTVMSGHIGKVLNKIMI